MKSLKLFLVILLAVGLMSCGKKTEAPKTSDADTKTETKKDYTPQIQLYKLSGVEKSTGSKIAPNFSWDENGKKASLTDLKGKVVFVNFWATWCGPCKKEMPDLSEISKELKDKNFKMLGMNVFQQEGTPKVDDFLRLNPLSYAVIDGNDELVKAFGDASGNDMQAIPVSFIINKEGKIVETIVGSKKKDEFLNLINKYL